MVNREIKFRVWDIDAQKMFYREGFTILDFIKDGYNSALEKNVPWMLDDSKFIIQQFTGLKDKNGREIYEGDIINWELENYTLKGRVYWGDCGWRLWDINLDCSIAELTIAVKNYKIIGNIFENSELLKND